MSQHALDDPTEALPSRYVVGIDLGTTNSAVCYVDTNEEPWTIRTFLVPQSVAANQVEARETLPSFHYEPAPGELAEEALRLPWSRENPEYTVGVLARDHGAAVPGRLISSAKSWLSHSGVDRTAELLPWHGAADVARLSPVEVSARYLQHVRDAWNDRFPDAPLEGQDVVLTLPASFDEVARELTVQAAARAGLPRVVLIEEPQAAFYAWIHAHTDNWEEFVEPGQKILVCDIGGGTSDFTLIRVRRGAGDEIQFHRVAVGEHLILGGDNLDLALAHHIERKLKGGGKLEPRQWDVLVRTCRNVKESLLSEDAPAQRTVTLPGAGARLLGGGLQCEVTRQEGQELLLEGFLPRGALGDKPSRRASGFQEFGLPYAADPAITRYLAAFLTAHRSVAVDDDVDTTGHDPSRPDIVLFNGGFFASPVLRQRLLDVLGSWFPADGTPWQPLVLQNERLDLAVARGAAYYGMVRRGRGVRIAAGLARTYYIGVESAEPAAVCLVPAGVEPGDDVDLTGRQFDLLISEPIEFPLFVSSTRLTDRAGDLIPIDREQMTPLPPIRTVLRTRRKGEAGVVAVNLHARLTEIGTLDLWCSETDGTRRWRLQFDVRSATQTDIAAHESAAEEQGFLDEAAWDECRMLIEATFGRNGKDNPEGLAKRLTKAIGLQRREWPTSLLRNIWEALMEVEAGRRRSQVHEARWLNLLGFSLRPGYGLAVDDWRVAETWRVLQGKLIHATPMCRAEWWVLWRRIAGGLPAGQQNALAAPLLAPIRALHRQVTTGKGKGGTFSASSHDAAEVWRFLGALELLNLPTKIELGQMIVDLLPKPKMEPVRSALGWALARIGARTPVYGPLNGVIPVDQVARWLPVVMDYGLDESTLVLAVMQMSRRTHDRYRDLPDGLRDKVINWMKEQAASQHFLQLVSEGGALESEEQNLVFGEALPKGLRIL